MLKPRSYQQEAIDRTIPIIEQGKHVCIASPTGTGKTAIITNLCEYFINNNHQALIVLDKTELSQQTGEDLEYLKEFGNRIAYINDKTKIIPKTAHIYVCMVDSLFNRLKKDIHQYALSEVKYLLIDECHVQTFRKLYDIKPLDKCTRIGLTATPEYSGKKNKLKYDFDELVYTKSVPYFVQSGWLLNSKVYSFEVNTEQLKKSSTGDYTKESLSFTFDKEEVYQNVYENIIDIYKKEFNGQVVPTALFGVSKKFCENITNYFKSKQLKADYVTSGKLSAKERKQKISDWKNGNIDIMSNVQIFTKGFNYPGLKLIVKVYSTLIPSKDEQVTGRGRRAIIPLTDNMSSQERLDAISTSDKPYYVVADFGLNWKRHGITDIVDIDWKEKFEFEPKTFEAPTKTCPQCESEVHLSLTHCNVLLPDDEGILKPCGYEFPESTVIPKDKITPNTALELINKQKQIIINKYQGVPFDEMSIDELIEFADAKGYKKPWWIIHQLKKRSGAKMLIRELAHKLKYSPKTVRVWYNNSRKNLINYLVNTVPTFNNDEQAERLIDKITMRNNDFYNADFYIRENISKIVTHFSN